MRAIQWMSVIWLTTCFVGCNLIAQRPHRPTGKLQVGATVAIAVATIVFFGLVAWCFRAGRRLSRRARTADCRLCFECMYDLRGSGDGLVAGGACPECGKTYQFASLKMRWDSFAQHL